MPAVILIVSIWRLRSLIKQFDASVYMIKERLMIFHLALYSLFICSQIMFMVTAQYYYASFDGGKATGSCQLYRMYRVNRDINVFLAILLIMLQAYMCAKFSAPADGSRRKFLLVYKAQAESFKSAREEHSEDLERSRYERYTKAAIRDADLQIKLWSVLTEDISS